MFKNLVIALSAVTAMAQAESLHPDTFGGAVGQKQQITRVEREGKVVRVRRSHPFTKYIIEIPVTVAPKDACTKITGQKNLVDGGRILEIAVMGKSTSQNCIEIVPRPVDMTVKFEMNILTGGFVPAATIQKQVVQFHGIGLHTVTLNLDNKVVTIKPLARRPR